MRIVTSFYRREEMVLREWLQGQVWDGMVDVSVCSY